MTNADFEEWSKLESSQKLIKAWNDFHKWFITNFGYFDPDGYQYDKTIFDME